ncbi:MAG: HAD-IIB family hydrolase [Candidatus Aenigmarchaeota archaeon]|nr:HAD-IIB family hydrolase [Candidatus Aenigmarchaeota archaeon]
MTHKYYNIDCDGVLKPYTPASEKRPFDSEAVRGIGLLTEMGYKSAIVSGKNAQYLLDVAHMSGLHDDFYLIGENGAVVTDSKGKRLYVASRDGYHELKEILLNKFIRENVDGWKRFEWNEGVGYVMEEEKEATFTLLVKSEDGLLPKFIRYVANATQQVIKDKGLPFQLAYNITSPCSGYVDITPKNVNKATGLMVVSEYLGIKPEEMRAIGDSKNDLPMLKFVGYPRAVGNADKDVKKVVEKKGGYIARNPYGKGVLEIAMYEKALFSS